MSFEVRAAVDGDRASLSALVQAFPTSTPPDSSTFDRVFEAKLGDPSSFLGLVETDGGAVGYVSGYRHAAFYASGQAAWVDELYVHPEHRGRGLGRALMESFESWAASHDCRLVGLATLGAREFYIGLGYESKAGYFKKYLS